MDEDVLDAIVLMIIGNTIVGFNYTVARTSNSGDSHTETQLLHLLPQMLKDYHRVYSKSPPAVLLYTRGSPCPDCTKAINYAGYNDYVRGQFVVAYTTNIAIRTSKLTVRTENTCGDAK